MALPLRQHTATVIWIGPFIAATDGFTRQTSLALTGTGLWFSKLGGAFALGTGTATMGGGANGWYSHNLASSEADTAGRLRVDYNATGSAASLPPWHEYVVKPQQVYDSINTATDLLQIDVVQWNAATVATATGTQPNVNVTHINGNAVTATGTLFPADVIQWTHQNVSTATGSQPNINLTHIGGATLATGSAQLGVNVAAWGLETVSTATGGRPNVNITHYTGLSLGTATGTQTLIPVNAVQVQSASPETATNIAQTVRDISLVTGTATSLGNAISEINRLTATYLDAKISSRSALTSTDLVAAASEAINNNLGAISSNVWSYEGADVTNVPTATGYMYQKMDFLFCQAVGLRTVNRSASMERLVNLGGTATIASAAFSDDGTTFTHQRWGTATA